MRILYTCTIALTLFSAGAAVADEKVLDMSTIDCKRFAAYDKDNTALIMTYLEAYYLTDNDAPVLNFTKMGTDTKNLLEFCTANPTVGLITAADKLMGKKK